MTVGKVIALPLLGALLAFGLAACERQGPAERAGERMDDAIDSAGDNMEDAGDRMRDAMD